MENVICYTAVLTYPNGQQSVRYGTYAEMHEEKMSVEDSGGSGVVIPVIQEN